MEPLAEARGFLVCHPEGTVDRVGWRFWNATDACCHFYGSNVDDSAYLRGLIEELARQYKVDRKRIYVTGHSNGGYMSYRMACDHADLIAGIASLAGMTFLDSNTPRPSQPVNVLQIHGTADETVFYAGGTLPDGWPVMALLPGAVVTVQTWASFNGCQGPQWDAQPSMDLDLAVAGLDTTVMRYTNSPPGGAVELWTINGGRHTPTLSAEFSPRVIDWLLAHPKP
jgi:polyhydroxybutyrate depolymerase